MKDTTANRITVFRIMLIPLFLVFAYADMKYWAFGTYAVACISDFLDGYLARKYNEKTVFGAFMDPLADKMLVFAVMCFFIQVDKMPAWVVAIALLREFAVSGLRMMAAQNNQVISAGWSGKIKTASTMACLAAMLLFDSRCLNIICICIILVTTLCSGIEYFIINKHIFKEEK